MKFEIHFEFRASLRKFQDLNFWDATKTEPPNFASIGRTYGDALCSRDWEEALLQLWHGGHTRVGIFLSP